jgi:hypothetical protein
MSIISLVQNVSYRIQVNYPNPGGNPPATLKIIWSLKRNGQVVSGVNFPSPVSFEYVPNHPSSILTNVILNPSRSANISLQEGDELLVRVEARNDISSVPVFLEANAIIARIFPNVILEPITLRKQNEPNVILPFNLLFDTDNDPTGTVLFLGGPTGQQTSPVTEWENESLFPREYVWTRGNDVVGTGPTYTIVEEDKDSFLSVQLTVRNGNSLARRTGSLVVGNPSEDNGFTDLTQFIASDSRIVYIAANGNDAAAAQAKDRGYYLPSDPEIGADPTQPAGTIQAYATIAAARAAQRDAQSESLAGEPEWMLFRRGDSFTIGSLIGKRTSGRSETERRVFGAYGNPSIPRPIVQCIITAPAMQSWVGGGNYAVSSLDFRGSTAPSIFNFMYGARNILLEDLVFGVTGPNTIQEGAGDIVIRRCVVSGNFSASSHVQGLFASTVQGDFVIEECVFDMNGYKENPSDPATWTRGVAAGGLPVGTGVQPRRTWFDRNLYLSSYESVSLRGNIISRGGGASSVQMREGGIAERNVFIWCPDALAMSSSEALTNRQKGSIVRDNLVLHDDCFLPPGAFGVGITASGASDDIGILDGNIVAHFHRGSNGGRALSLTGKSSDGREGREPEPLLTGIATNNDIFLEFGADGFAMASATSASGVLSATVSGNKFFTTQRISVAGDASMPSSFVYEGNAYSSPAASPFRIGSSDRTLAQWQAAGYDSDAYFSSNFAAFKTAAGWVAPERDIVSYMQSIDPTYIPNENVTTDDGVPAEKRRPNAQRVWEALSDPSLDSFFRIASVDQAKLAARRYHAFLVFIERAKANRKGAWDPAYTADALNNYIRGGFGKQPVGGPYDTRPIEDRFSDYIQ